MTYAQGINPKDFVKSVTSHLKGKVIPNAKLQRAWEIMADTFNRHIQGKAVGEWSVLALPTGTGKTEGLAIYCANIQEHPGILIITRFTAEADKLVKKINRLAGQDIAHARHAENMTATDEELASFPILIITHNKYARDMVSVSKHKASGVEWVLPEYRRWKNGARALTVIDETLDVTDHIKVELDELRLICGSIPYLIEKEFPRAVSHLRALLETFTLHANGDKSIGHLFPAKWQRQGNDVEKTQRDLLTLIKAIENYSGIGGDEEISQRQKGFEKVLSQKQTLILQRLMQIISTDSLYAKQGNSYALHLGRVKLPTDIESAVVLDATASLSYTYNMQGTFVKHVPLPSKIRNYQNVTLYVRYGLSTGKDTLGKKSPEFFLDLVEGIQPSIARKKVLICTAKKVRNNFGLVEKKFPSVKLAHWNDIDGKNDWQEFSTVIICGLPRLGEVISECAILAFETWHQKANQKYNPDAYFDDENRTLEVVGDDDYEAHNEYERSHMAVSVIQAINRVRCRRPIDVEGNCQATDIHLFLRSKDRSDEAHLLQSIRQAMPGIEVIESDIPGELKAEKLTTQEMKVIQLFESLPMGKSESKKVYRKAKERGISERTFQRKLQELKDNPTSLFSCKVNETGVEYKGERGKYAQSYFRKA